MQSAPPDPEGLDSSWDDEEDENPENESTRMIDSKELFERAGFTMEEPAVQEPPPQGRIGRITRRQPTAEINEHVSKARPSGAHENPTIPRMPSPWSEPPVGERFEDTLDSLLQERSSQLECDEPGVASVPGFGAAPPLDDEDDLLGGLEPVPPARGPRGGQLRAPPAPPRPEPRLSPRERRGAAPPPIDLNLDLAFEMPDLDSGEVDLSAPPPPPPPPSSLPPMTPPPGTLRLGLLEDDLEPTSSSELRDLRAAAAAPPKAAPPPRQQGGHAPTLIPGARPISRVPAPPAAPAALAAPTADDRRRQMLQRFESGDYSGALVLAEAILDENPDDASARRYAESCNEMLRQMYRSRIGDGSQVLRILISSEELRSLNLDHRAGFLLSCIDGMSSIDDVLDVSGMRELEALRILFELVQESIIAPSD
ncbi:MAG TPA: hypothetical protein VLS89_19935 [Candidatus Nanopelagicales bacterium]|nr:hypothetical protein [Candidatus Nanopelagicales bacterium]